MEELLPNRDSKMRRFCNYFLTLFNQKKLNPFTQFIQTNTLKKVKAAVRVKMQYFQQNEDDTEKPQKLPSMPQPKSLT